MLTQILTPTPPLPQGAILAQGTPTQGAKFSPQRTANNHTLTTPSGVDTRSPAPPPNSLKNGVEAVLVRRVTGKELKAFREQFGISARGLAQLLNYSRSYIKRIESKQDSLRASVKFSEKFYALRTEWANVPAPMPKQLTIIGPGTLADDVTTLVLSVKPRRCQWSKCHCAFVPRDRRQKFCSDAHRDAHARAKGKHQRRKSG